MWRIQKKEKFDIWENDLCSLKSIKLWNLFLMEVHLLSVYAVIIKHEGGYYLPK